MAIYDQVYTGPRGFTQPSTDPEHFRTEDYLASLVLAVSPEADDATAASLADLKRAQDAAKVEVIYVKGWPNV